MTEIVPYQKHHQNGIDEMMIEIASEFGNDIFPKPTKSTPLIPDLYWVATVNNEVVGTIGFMVIQNEYVVLKKMMLKEAFRGKQLGTSKSLLKTVFSWCKENDLQKIYLGTMNQFVAAQKFYERNGFKRINRNQLPGEFPINPLDKVFFLLKLDFTY